MRLASNPQQVSFKVRVDRNPLASCKIQKLFSLCIRFQLLSRDISKFPFPFNPRSSRPRPPSRHRRKVECTTPQRENGPARSCRCRCRKCLRVLVFLQIIFAALTPCCCPSFASSSAPSCSSSCVYTREPFFACPSTQVFRGVLQRLATVHGNECATYGLSSLSCSHFLWVSWTSQPARISASTFGKLIQTPSSGLMTL